VSDQKHIHVLELPYLLNLSDNPQIKLRIKDLSTQKVFELKQTRLTDLLHLHVLVDNLILQNENSTPPLELTVTFAEKNEIPWFNHPTTSINFLELITKNNEIR
jgi:hypothetical protein